MGLMRRVEEMLDESAESCNGFGCRLPKSGLHHDKINGPHYWCRDCEGCSRCGTEEADEKADE